MSRRQVEVTVGPIVILLTLVFVGHQAFTDMKAYSQSVSELYQRERLLEGRRLKVTGKVVPGSIVRGTNVVRFAVAEGNQTLEVHYIGMNPLPDTFRNYSEAVIDGQYSGNGLFRATRLEGQVRLEGRTEHTQPDSVGLSQPRFR